jgi:hypothetical protein
VWRSISRRLGRLLRLASEKTIGRKGHFGAEELRLADKISEEEGKIIVCPQCGAKNMRTEMICVKCDSELPTARERLMSAGVLTSYSPPIDNLFERDVLNYLKRIDYRVSFLYWLVIIGIVLSVIALLVSVAIMA